MEHFLMCEKVGCSFTSHSTVILLSNLCESVERSLKHIVYIKKLSRPTAERISASQHPLFSSRHPLQSYNDTVSVHQSEKGQAEICTYIVWWHFPSWTSSISRHTSVADIACQGEWGKKVRSKWDSMWGLFPVWTLFSCIPLCWHTDPLSPVAITNFHLLLLSAMHPVLIP